MPLTWIEINKKNLYHNTDQFKKLAPKSEVWAVVKSNAYGHGLKEIVSLLDKDKNTTGFMVVNLSEALELKKISKKPVMVLSYFDRSKKSLDIASSEEISLPVYDLETIDYLDSLGKNFLLNVKIDTGASRLGFLPDQAIQVIGYIKDKKKLRVNSIFTHYAESESSDKTFTKKQLKLLESVSKKYPQLKVHSACSAAAVNILESQQDMIRLGVSLYGLWPSHNTLKNAFNIGISIKPVMSFKTKIIQLKVLQPGDSIGYDRTYICDKKCLLAVIPVGYNEGYNRLFSNKAEVLINGKRFKIRGNICMNLSMVELPEDEDVRVGEVVTLLGQDKEENISADELAKISGTINYEIVTKINSQLPRIIV